MIGKRWIHMKKQSHLLLLLLLRFSHHCDLILWLMFLMSVLSRPSLNRKELEKNPQAFYEAEKQEV